MVVVIVMLRCCWGCEGDDDIGVVEGVCDVVVVIGGCSEEWEVVGVVDVVVGCWCSWWGVVVVVGEVEWVCGVFGICWMVG